MGSKKAWKKLDFWEKEEARRELSEQFGIDKSEYGPRGRPGEYEYKSIESLDERIGEAVANDYDYRRSLEAASMAGNKKAQKIGGVSGIADAYAAHKFMKKTHRNRMGNGGAYDGANDEYGVTDYWINKDREKFASRFASTDDLNSLKEKLQEQAAGDREAMRDAANPIEPSDRLAQAQSRLATAHHDPGSLYDKNNADVPVADDQKDAANNFLWDYKVDVTRGARLRDDMETNVSNASNTVTNIYAR